MGETIKFSIGGQWEGAEWEIQSDLKVGHEKTPCPHCFDDSVVTLPNAFGGTFERREWKCPRVIVMKNEGGYASTGLCLDCVLEAVKNVDLTGV